MVQDNPPIKERKMMQRPATWKVITVGAALTGLGIVGAGAAGADTPEPAWVPEFGVVSATNVMALDDDWTETYWDD